MNNIPHCKTCLQEISSTASKVSKYGVFSGPYFPAFRLNTERYYGVFSGPYFPPFGLNTERYWISRFSKYDLLASSISFFVIDQFSFCCFLYNPNKAGLFKVSCFSRRTLIQLLNNLFKVG